MPSKTLPTSKGEGVWLRVFQIMFGSLIALSLLKFGNPCVFAKLTPWPKDGFEWALDAWPVEIGYWLLAMVAVSGIFCARLQSGVPRWLLAAPVAWLSWQFVSATRTLDPEMTRLTLPHFTACMVCFYLGVFCLGHARRPMLFWFPILCAMAMVFVWGLQQHFGGLEETRRYFYAYIYPNLSPVPPEYLKRVSSDRIFATLFYPNALAGAVLLLLPPTLVVLWRATQRLTLVTSCVLMAAYAGCGLACMYWSGSKGGWLLMMICGLVAMLHRPFALRLKAALVVLVLAGGLAGFVWKYASFFEKGAKSVHARFDYWEAGLKTAAANPVFGSGPGAFGVSYKAIKNPESEMARLTHNDYLEQASDSGVIGLIAYSAWVLGMVGLGYSKEVFRRDSLPFAAWLGVLGLAMQSAVEFGLYIPALSWSAFAIGGCATGQATRLFDRRKPADGGKTPAEKS